MYTCTVPELSKCVSKYIIILLFPAVNCGALDHPKNGFVDTVPDTYLNSTATYSCNQGYDLTGNTQRVCQSNGLWSSSAPYCAGETT